MAKRKGIIQVAEEKLDKVEGILEAEYEKYRECSQEQIRCESRLKSPHEELTIDERLALEKEALDWYEKSKICIKRISGIKEEEIYQAKYELQSAKDAVKKARTDVENFKEEQKIHEKGLEELKRNYQNSLEVFEKDINYCLENLQQAQLEFNELEGN